MVQRTLSILMLSVMVCRVCFGASPGAIAICLGGGHEHGPDEVAAECELACEHTTFPTAVPIDNHDDDCDCTDVEVWIADLLTTVEDRRATIQVSVSVADWIVDDHATCVSWRGPPRARGDDPATRQRLAIVRSTRLII